MLRVLLIPREKKLSVGPIKWNSTLLYGSGVEAKLLTFTAWCVYGGSKNIHKNVAFELN